MNDIDYLKEKKEELKELQEAFSIEEESVAVEEAECAAVDSFEGPFNVKDVDIKTSTTTIDNIIKRLKHEEIDLSPDFQRRPGLWDNVKKSSLIESLLIKIPLPAFYFDGTDDSKWLVVDGLQRLNVINDFIVSGEMKLSKMEYLTHLNGKRYSELPRALQRVIEESLITIYVINKGTPDNLKFNIFKRINTGGLTLTMQEIRHALNQGRGTKFIAELASSDEFKLATSGTVIAERMADREFVTRFLSMYLYRDDYSNNLDTFLSNSMKKLNSLEQATLNDLDRKFKSSMGLNYDIFGKYAFRKTFSNTEKLHPINKALFEVWSVELAKLSEDEIQTLKDKKKQLFDGFKSLMDNDEDFMNAITSGTNDKKKVNHRFTTIENLLKKVLKHD